jgi:ubiquinone/menaquinone biosynthesis C-methylase UbiE
MIARAKRMTPANASFHRVDSAELPLADASIDAAFSVHVFQHLESKSVIERYLHEVHRVLRPGGSVMLHLMLRSRAPSIAERVERELRLLRSRRQLTRGREHTAVRMTMPTMEEGFQLFAGAGYRDTELHVFPVRSNGFHHSFYLGRRVGS